MITLASIIDSAWSTAKVSGPLLTALAGIFIGAWLTRSREQAAWLRSCEKEEWKELLTALVNAETAFGRMAAFIMSDIFSQPVDAAHINALSTAVTEVYRTQYARIFIYDALDRGHLLEQWHAVQDSAYKAIRNNQLSKQALTSVANDFSELRSLVRKVALERMAPKTTLQRLQFWKG